MKPPEDKTIPAKKHPPNCVPYRGLVNPRYTVRVTAPTLRQVRAATFLKILTRLQYLSLDRRGYRYLADHGLSRSAVDQAVEDLLGADRITAEADMDGVFILPGGAE